MDRSTGLRCDQSITLTGSKASRLGMPVLRRVGYRDPETNTYYEFMTNNFKLSAKTIADIYQQRWQVELFFKWIKQNLKIKAFLGTSKNAVMTQIWVALCTCLLLTFIKFSAQLGWPLQTMLRVLQLNLFMRRDLLALLRGDPPDKPEKCAAQLCLI